RRPASRCAAAFPVAERTGATLPADPRPGADFVRSDIHLGLPVTAGGPLACPRGARSVCDAFPFRAPANGEAQVSRVDSPYLPVACAEEFAGARPRLTVPAYAGLRN